MAFYIKIFCIAGLLVSLFACGGSGGGSGGGRSSASSSDVSSSSSSSVNSSVSSSSNSSVTSSASSSASTSNSSASNSSANSSSANNSSEPTRVDSGLSERAQNTSCHAPAAPGSALGDYAYQWVDGIPSGVENPIFLAQPAGENNRYYVVNRSGRIHTFVLGDSNATTAVDFSDEVTTEGEGGALSLAFHPDFANNRYAYVFLTARRQAYGISNTDVSMVTVVRRYTVSANGLAFTDPLDIVAPLNASDTRLNHQWTNHKGGWIGFSPIDGYLYIAMGDRGEGAGGEPLGNNFSHIAQNLNSLHGKILRIDVDGAVPYAIPADNPFADGGGAAEIFAWGFRNPWRASFDRLTGDLWVGDVGEGTREEISKVVLGGNYGWPFREGHYDRCNNCARGQESLPPVVDMPHTDGWVAVIGGYVYRGDAMPELQGRYIFGDFIRSGITTISYDNDGNAFVEDLLANGGSSPTLAEDNAGNIWRIHSWGGFERLARTQAPPAAEFPATLSATGCFAAQNIHQPAAGVVAYDLNSPLWSDGAAKRRYFALPDNTQINIEDNGDWSFPIGSVLIKTFLLHNQPVETRLLVRHSNGEWGGYSYEWNDAGTEAHLLAAGKTKAVGDQLWQFPSRAQCMNCHTAPNGNLAYERVLGLETAQLNRDFIYPGNVIANQIQTLASVGYFTEDPGAPASLAQLPNPISGTAAVADRARAYLHSNCANCHQPNGPGRGGMDFRYSTHWLLAGYCNQTPSLGNLGIANARLLKPGVAAESIIPLRMARSDAHRMPPLGVAIADEQGIAVIEDWINSLSGCE